MTKTELIELLRKILRGVDLAEDLKKKIQDLIDALEKNEPTSIVVARLLADLIELATGPLPGPISDFIKAYVEAFKNAIDQIIGLLWDRYRRDREQGLDHQEANDLVTPDAEICAWLNFRWAYEHMPPPPPPPGVTPPPLPPKWPGASGTPPGPPQPLWDSQDDNCCSRQNPPQEPTVTWIGSYFKDGGSWYIKGKLRVTHPCGLKYGPDTAIYIGTGSQDIKLQGGGLPDRPSPGGTGPIPGGEQLLWTKVQVAKRAPRRVRIHVRAVSRCIDVYDGFIELRKSP